MPTTKPRTPASPVSRARRRLVGVVEAADYWNVSTKTIRRRISDGTITGYRAGPRLIRVDLNELDALLLPIPAATDGSSDADAA